jgi:hypothetical protein
VFWYPQGPNTLPPAMHMLTTSPAFRWSSYHPSWSYKPCSPIVFVPALQLPQPGHTCCIQYVRYTTCPPYLANMELDPAVALRQTSIQCPLSTRQRNWMQADRRTLSLVACVQKNIHREKWFLFIAVFLWPNHRP